MTSKSQRFRRLIEAQGILVPLGVHELMRFATIGDIERQCLTPSQREAKYGVVR
jgi:hypothetical protein